MGLESVTHISDLNTANPTATDGLTQGDDHIRNIKVALKTDFPNVNGVVSASDEDLSAVENFQETVSATTSEVTIKTGKTLNIVDDGAGLEFGGTALAKTVSDLNSMEVMTILDTPELVVSSGSMVSGAWTTVNSATLNTATATKAILRCNVDTQATSATDVSAQLFIRKTGTTNTTNYESRVAIGRASESAATTIFADNVGTITVNLDASYDFDYYYSTFTDGTLGSNSSTIVLIGYYS